MHDFAYVRPGSLEEACRILEIESEALPIAGGMTLLAVMKQRLAAPSHLVDLSGLSELQGIETRRDGKIRIGAVCSHREVAENGIVKSSIRSLSDLAGGIGDPQVRNRGTLGGSIANNDPAADYPAALLALEAEVETTKRHIRASDFFTGMFEVALSDGELIKSVIFPRPVAAAYAKFPNPASRYALAGTMVAVTERGPKVAVSGAGG